ncbi:MAG: alpha-amylase family glycosyl hydrolase [Bacteroidota bacterium]
MSRNKILYKLILIILSAAITSAQTLVTTDPQFSSQTDIITITFDVSKATHQNKIAGYTGDVYVHTGVTIKTGHGTVTRWQNVIGVWGNNSVQPKLTRKNTDVYEITIDNPRTFYSVSDPSHNITELCFVLRSADGSKQTEDIFVALYEGGITVVINTPTVSVGFGDPMRSPVFAKPGGTINISASAAAIGTTTSSMKLIINGLEKAVTSQENIQFQFVADQYPTGRNDVKVTAADVVGRKDSIEFVIFKNPAISSAVLPQGSRHGINYDGSNVTLALFAPNKEFVYLIGDFNDWKVDANYLMKRYVAKPDSVIWWITLSNLTTQQEYAYQFLIDGTLRIYDPYTDKILDPSNDAEIINSGVYPNLKTYPSQKTSGIVSVLQTGQTPYNWKVINFQRPPKEKLIVYELLLRDFVKSHSYKTLTDTLSYFKKLGINAIELMPVSEFEGNDSWGYNPMTYFAPDKYYGTKNELKRFIDACHENGIAVILDIVLNHAYNSNSMAQMYWENGRPAYNNPWFNVQSNFQNPDAQWGNDFNHESLHTQYFVDRVLEYWLTEYKFDGFRFDFTKGFSNRLKTMSDPWGSDYDVDRIRLLKRIVDKVWTYDPTAIMIFEHLAVNQEDSELAHYGNGILMWGNMNYNYSEASMGWLGNSNFSNISYKARGWTKPHLIGYMESHDEERLMYKNLQFANSSGNYNIKNLQTALNRIKLAATFFLTIPGPKMIWQFGELGYDISINHNGRLGRKPVPWIDELNYYTNSDRKSLFNTFAALIRLKKHYNVFSTDNFVMDLSGAQKRINLSHSSMNAAIIGNFDVNAGSIAPAFQSTGWWHEFFTGDSLNVTNVNALIDLQPGEYRLYTSKKLIPFNIITDVKEEPYLKTDFVLYQNYPNPFNSSTAISYQLSTNSYVQLKIYDILGRETATLFEEFKPAGNYNYTFSIMNYTLPSGIYFYRLSVNGSAQTKKMVYLK